MKPNCISYGLVLHTDYETRNRVKLGAVVFFFVTNRKQAGTKASLFCNSDTWTWREQKNSWMDGRNNERKAFCTCKEKKRWKQKKKIKQEEVVENEKRKKKLYTERKKTVIVVHITRCMRCSTTINTTKFNKTKIYRNNLGWQRTNSLWERKNSLPHFHACFSSVFTIGLRF